MPITKKTLLPLNLATYDVYVNDTSENSQYFRISRLPSQFTGGRNSFLLGVTNNLQLGSQILIEIVDVRGNQIFNTVVPNYVESGARMISVEVYDTITPGPVTIRIVGKLVKTKDGKLVPTQWKNKFNVRWTKQVSADYFVRNTSPIRFLQKPTITVTENRFHSINSSSYTTFNVPFTASLLPIKTATVQTGYSLHAIAPSTFSSDHYNGTITGSIFFNSASSSVVTLPITKILNNTTAFSQGTVISSSLNNGVVSELTLYSGSYTSSIYAVTQSVTSSALLQYSKLLTSSVNIPISYANIAINRMKTVSGEVRKVKVYNKVSTAISNYKLVADVTVNTNEILTTGSIRGNLPIGNIALAENYTSSWYAGSLRVNSGSLPVIYPVSGNLSYYDSTSTATQFTVSSSSDVLLSSIYANVPIDNTTNKFANSVSGSGYFIGTKQGYTLYNGSEYTLTFDAYYRQTSSSINPSPASITLGGITPKLNIYLIGVNGTNVISNDPLGQKIGEIEVSGISNWFEQKQFNFTPAVQVSGSLALRFTPTNGFWNFSNISIRPASDPQFGPDEFRFIIPNTEYNNKPLTYKVEFFDINNNSVDVSAVSKPVFFTGSVTDLGTLS